MNSNRNSRHSQLGLLPRPPLNINALHVNLVEDFIIRIISSLILFLFLPLWGQWENEKSTFLEMPAGDFCENFCERSSDEICRTG